MDEDGNRHPAKALAGVLVDVEAAARSGVPMIALRCGGWYDQALRGVIAIYEDPLDLLQHYDSSPLGARQRRRNESLELRAQTGARHRLA